MSVWGNGFAMVPGWLVKKQPSANAVLVYIHLAMFGTFNPGNATYEQCRPSKKTLAGGDPKRGYPGTALSESTVGRSLRELEVLGAIKGMPQFDDKGAQLPTVYRLVFGSLAEEAAASPAAPLEAGGGVTSDTPPHVTGETGGVSLVTHNQEPLTKNPLTKKKIKTPPALSANVSHDAPPADLGTGGGFSASPEEPTPALSVLDQLVAELAAAGHWDAEVTREVLVELAKRGRDRGEIARVLRAVAAGAHGQTGSPRRMLAWWPGETPAAAGVPVESYRHQAAPRDAGRCYRHPDQPADCPLDDHPVLAGEITDAAAAAIAAARAKLPRGKPLSRRERPRATPPSTTPGEAVVSDVGAESDPESAAA